MQGPRCRCKLKSLKSIGRLLLLLTAIPSPGGEGCGNVPSRRGPGSATVVGPDVHTCTQTRRHKVSNSPDPGTDSVKILPCIWVHLSHRYNLRCETSSLADRLSFFLSFVQAMATGSLSLSLFHKPADVNTRHASAVVSACHRCVSWKPLKISWDYWGPARHLSYCSNV